MIYRLLKSVAKVVLFFIFKVELIGKDRIPSGAVIVAANHISNFDPIILSCMFKRDIHFIAKKELFSNHFSNWFFHKLHAIPVDRHNGTVIRPVRHGLDVLKRGEVFGIFPEGKRCKEGERIRSKKGVAFFGCKTDAPILPVAIVRLGTGLRRTPIKIIIGDPIYTANFLDADYDFISQVVMGRINEFSELYDWRNNEYDEQTCPHDL